MDPSRLRPNSALVLDGPQLPNIPGMAVTKSSWVYKKLDGFNKINSSGKIFYERGGRYEGDAMNYQFGGTNAPGNVTRPATAGPGIIRSRTAPQIMDLSRSMSNIHFATESNNNGDFEGTMPITRPQTASTTMLRPSADRTGKFFFQSKLMAPSATRKLEKVPAFVETEKVVTRFFAFFNYDRTYDRASALGAPSIPKADARYLTILFYVADSSCEISETKEQNSGLEGGVFYGRAKLAKDDGDTVQLLDLVPGNVLRALGREIHIFDADTFTRDYFRRELKIALPPVVTGPNAIRPDQSAQQATGLGFNKEVPMKKKTHGVRSTDYSQRKEDLEKTRRYLQFDGRLLRFMCIDAPGTKSASTSIGTDVDMNPATGDLELTVPSSMKKFALTYTLSDSSIEMRVQKSKQNSANIDNWLLLKKSRLPRNWKDVQRGLPQELYEPSDLIIGSVIDIYGRKFLLVDCDEYSRDYYASRNMDQPTLNLVVDDGPVYVHEIPKQGDSFLPIGGPEDTLATCYGQPKNVGNQRSAGRSQNRQLRCKIKILSASSIDGSRPLQLIYHLNDDSIQIYEVPVRNSGISGGNYLKRGKYFNYLPPAGEEPRRFIKTDIFLGNIFSINGQEMQIIEMDSATLRFCEAYAHDFPMSDTFKIVHGMVEKTINQKIDLRTGFQKLDPNNVGYVDQHTFVRALDSWGLSGQLYDQELITILRRFQGENPGQTGVVYLYHELCDLFSHICAAQRSYSKHGSLKNLTQGRVDDLSELLSFLRSRTTQWRRAFRKGCVIPGRVTLETIAATLKTHGVLLSDDAKTAMRLNYSPPTAESSSSIKILRVSDSIKNKAMGNLPSKVSKSKLQKMNITGITSPLRFTSAQDGSSSPNLGTMLTADIDAAAKEALAAAKNNQTALQAAIVHRRQKLMSSVLRPDGQELKRIEQEKLDAEAEVQFQLADSSVVINYDKLCNDVYVCDWA